MNLKQLSLAKVYKVVAVLLLLAVGSSMLATAPLAKYVTQVAGSDSARVAQFKVSATGKSSQSYNLTSETKTGTYDFTVTSNSEVATTYDVKVKLADDAPSTGFGGVTPTLTKNDEDSTSARPATWDSTTKTYTFTGVGTMTAGTSNTDTLHLTFTKADDATAATYSNIKVEAVVTQVD